MYTIKIVQKQREENKRIANLKKIANSLLIGIALRIPLNFICETAAKLACKWDQGVGDPKLESLTKTCVDCKMDKHQALKTAVFSCPARRFLCFEDPLVFPKGAGVSVRLNFFP